MAHHASMRAKSRQGQGHHKIAQYLCQLQVSPCFTPLQNDWQKPFRNVSLTFHVEEGTEGAKSQVCLRRAFKTMVLCPIVTRILRSTNPIKRKIKGKRSEQVDYTPFIWVHMPQPPQLYHITDWHCHTTMIHCVLEHNSHHFRSQQYHTIMNCTSLVHHYNSA